MKEIEKKKDELYRKVYIKSESDLPKEEGDYFCNRSGFNSVQHLMTTLGKSYMREIRWYLQPLAESQEQSGREDKNPTDYDIENASLDYINDFGDGLLTSFRQRLRTAYKQGARDMRDNNIYISPKK